MFLKKRKKKEFLTNTERKGERERETKGRIMIRAKGCEGKKRGTRERRTGKEGEAVKGRQNKKVAKRNKVTTTVRVNERGRECSCRLMRHAHVGTCLRPHPRSPRTSINNPSTPVLSENCR